METQLIQHWHVQGTLLSAVKRNAGGQGAPRSPKPLTPAGGTR